MTSRRCLGLVSQVARTVLWYPGYADREGFFILSQTGWVISIAEIVSGSHRPSTEHAKPNGTPSHGQKSHTGDDVAVFCLLVDFKINNNKTTNKPSGVRDQNKQSQSHAKHRHEQTQPTEFGFREMGPSLFSAPHIHQFQGNFSGEPQSIITYFPINSYWFPSVFQARKSQIRLLCSGVGRGFWH